MKKGKTLFAKLMEYKLWKSFGRIITRHGAEIRILDWANFFRS
jgi:hypothetical protein